MTRHTPTTTNPEAKALIELAQSKCEGCRTVWRFKKHRTEEYAHRGPKPMLCTAQAERQELRQIADRPRAYRFAAVYCDDVGGGP